MDRNEILERLREKLDGSFTVFQNELLDLSPTLIIEKAKEIEATRIVYNELYSGWAYPDELLEYLLRFENPLEVMRDRWKKEQLDIRKKMKDVLWSLMNERKDIT